MENASLKAYNTFGIDVRARYLSSFSSLEELTGLPLETDPLLILGGGSNVLLRGDIDGLVLLNRIKGIFLVREDDRHIYVRVGAGENWHGFVEHALERNWAGVENLSLIPGNVGSSPIQNIGAYGVEIKDVFHELSAYHIEEKKVYTFSLNDCEFGYRESVFKQRLKGQFVILEVIFRLNKVAHLHMEYGAIKEELGDIEPTIRSISDAVIRIRRSKLPDPAVIGNAGSFFKNPTVTAAKFEELRNAFPDIVGYPSPRGVRVPAGWLIEQCGWKGYRRGDAGVHARQALVLVNYGHASGKEIFDLCEEIQESVRAKFGVELEREVNIIP